MDDSVKNKTEAFITPIGRFTINSYEIPVGYTLSCTPAIISDADDVHKIITIDQSVQLGTDQYTPVLHQNCMSPEQKIIYPLTIVQSSDKQIILTDHFHSLILDPSELPDIQIHPWYPVIKKKSCIPCTNCGRCGW